MKLRAAVLSIVVLTLSAGEARAQWDVPSFLAPRPQADAGIYISDLGDFGIEGIWRRTGNLNLGLRVGYIDTYRDGLITVGAETWGLLAPADQSLPVDVTWTAGLGATFNGGTSLAVPLGLSIGRTLDLGTRDIQVYGHPRIELLFHSDGRNGDDDADLDAVLDIGADIELSARWTLRVGASLGGPEALGIGLASH